jgi:hypothetical protein
VDSPPTDSLDLPSLRDGSRRDIPWSMEVPELDEARRARLIHAWSWRRNQEHLAVGSFCVLAYEAAQHGCEPATLALLTRAATDEVHHADQCRRMVEKHSGKALPTTLRGVPHLSLPFIARDGAIRPVERSPDGLLLRIVETCCLSETFTGAYFTDMLELATHPLARAVVLSLLEDEIDHGRVGWAYLAAAVRDGRAGFVADELPALVLRNVKDIFDDGRTLPEADDPMLDMHGYMGRTRAAQVYHDAINRIILPGFEALDIDTKKTRAMLEEHGYASMPIKP